jgi:transposase
MRVINGNAAGIDIGDTMHAVAVPAGRDKSPVKKFGTFTCDLMSIIQWLKKCGVTTVAMESTGVYWKPLFVMLIQYGFDPWLVNSRQTKNISGKKTDMEDAAWIQQLHSCGLLTRSFLPDDLTETLRSIVRQRRVLLQDSNRCILRIQKQLEVMNIKIHTVINDIMGKTGSAILEAIIDGERKAENFLPLIDKRIQASDEDIRKSLEGNWRPENVFLIKQCYSQYQQLHQHMLDCDKEVEKILGQMSAIHNEGIIEPVDTLSAPQDVAEPTQAGTVKKKKKRKSKNTPVYNVRQYLHQIHGVDVLDIFGISEISAMEILSETGTDLSKWATQNNFISWLNLCPNNKITGGKLISSKLMKKAQNNASRAFRAAANGLRAMDNWLGDYFRRMRGKGGQKFAIVCTARKLALIYYKMVRYKVPFMPVNIDEYKERHRKAKIASLEKKLAELRKAAA